MNNIFVKIFLLSYILINITPIYAYSYINNTINNPNKINNNYSTSYLQQENNTILKELNELEKYSFNQSYDYNSEYDRLSRLERHAFGATQMGDINSRLYNVRNAILTRPKNNYKKSFLRHVGDYFLGQMTGYTPTMQSNLNNQRFSTNSYPSNFNNTQYESYNTPFGNGFHTNDYGINNSSSIKILD